MFIGIDCGTQSTKALVVDDKGEIRGRGSAAHRLIQRDTGAREQEPAWWVDAMISAVREAVAQAGIDGAEVKAIGVSGQQHGLVVLDEAGRSIRPAKLWNDTSTASQNAELIETLGGRQAWIEAYGIVPRTGYTLSKLLWLRQNEPENFKAIRHILLPHDYLNYWLTGRCVAEYGDASGTAFFDIRRRRWALEPLAAIDGGSGFLAQALPELISSASIVGPLTREAAEALGLSTGCLVSAGGGDNMMAAIGTGNVREGIVTMSLGTSATLYSYSDTPVIDPSDWAAPFCSSSGGWLPLICTMNCTNVTGGAAILFGQGYAYVGKALAASQPGAGGLTLLPFFNGERTPDLPNARGSLLGLTDTNMTAENFVRAAVEGTSFGVLGGMRRILGDTDPQRIFLVGGGAKSPEWRQLIADATGAEIVVPVTEEAGCLGGAVQAIWAYGRERGTPEEISAITERCIAVDETKTARARDEARSRYDAAFALYRQRLLDMHGVEA
ncbi:xylulokinase [Consotaella aegiceratis]|uniref:xylulokinase n=1 Tax=Consotaella aegiceratis TaxID=3097961 RepID=UPI002F42C0B0